MTSNRCGRAGLTRSERGRTAAQDHRTEEP